MLGRMDFVRQEAGFSGREVTSKDAPASSQEDYCRAKSEAGEVAQSEPSFVSIGLNSSPSNI